MKEYSEVQSRDDLDLVVAHVAEFHSSHHLGYATGTEELQLRSAAACRLNLNLIKYLIHT